MVLQIDTTSTRFQLRFLAAGLSIEFAVHLTPKPALQMRRQDINGTKTVLESFSLQLCAASSAWNPTRWSFASGTVEIDICGEKALEIQRLFQHESNELGASTTPLSLLVGSEEEALWSVCLE